ncbi:hypothetical protein BDV39DRAFT_206794 [Aspergillus sergii]|uniref:EthD domain-containing protein n=1 Tax=Aspergillus sergii TaxID=1034303 RepID=A0A5N6WXN1_9EURO|nr:hypothetical protein BDV39DRAFT_206794 [Aspergillus sergii]
MAPQKQLVLRLTSFRYKKEGIPEKDFHEYGTREHAPKAARIQQRHGAIKVTQAVRPNWSIDDYDVSISVYVRSPETLQVIVTDPEFQSLIAGQDDILDQTRTHVTAGWEERTSMGQDSKTASAPEDVRI